ncbi:uncharacterized protein LOC131641768 [Vicia villosa]|uniref:uncharacterized protein LOC131641768 n=1 Tax=Vicia villosa TaxID=3911 RepID=UPI00273CC0F1|nr:uncharacterized protein LOC131641768 [Vicia villosa]
MWWKDIMNINIDSSSQAEEFSVREAYKELISSSQNNTSSAWSRLWNRAIPSKVSGLGWRLLQNRIPTVNNLIKRGVLDQNSNRCAGECGREESVSHLFFECTVFAGIWNHILQWLGVKIAMQRDGWQHLEQFEGLISRDKTISTKLTVIWFACIWCIWKARNEKIFQNEEINIEKNGGRGEIVILEMAAHQDKMYRR